MGNGIIRRYALEKEEDSHYRLESVKEIFLYSRIGFSQERDSAAVHGQCPGELALGCTISLDEDAPLTWFQVLR